MSFSPFFNFPRAAVLLLVLLANGARVSAQSDVLTKAQSQAKLEQLRKLDGKYEISGYACRCDVAIFRKGDKYGLVRLDGEVIAPARYLAAAFEPSAHLFALNKEGFVGFVNCKGHTVVPFELSGERAFMGNNLYVEGLLAIERDGRYGILDSTGHAVVPFVYESPLGVCSREKELMYSYSAGRDTCCLLRFCGDTVIGMSQTITLLADGRMEVRRDDLYGYYDPEGAELIPCQFDEPLAFVGGKSMAKKGGRYGVVDTKGGEVVPCSESRYAEDQCILLQSGLICQYQGDRCGVTDINGNEIVPPIYRYFYSDAFDRIVMIDTTEGLTMLDTKGHFLERYDFEPELDDDGFAEGGFPICQNGRWGFVNHNWRTVVPPRYRELEQLDKFHFSVLLDDGQRAIIDIVGTTVVQGPYLKFRRFCDGIYRAYSHYNNGKDRDKNPQLKGFVDIYGSTSFTPEELERMKKWMPQQ